jgi:polar amino acid transport system substrate-binding protein
MKEKLDVTRKPGIDAAFKDLLDGKADYLIAGYYPGFAEAAKEGLKDKIVALNQALLSQEMFVAFSKKSPCLSLMPKFAQGITQLTTDDSYDKMLVQAEKDWKSNQAGK